MWLKIIIISIMYSRKVIRPWKINLKKGIRSWKINLKKAIRSWKIN